MLWLKVGICIVLLQTVTCAKNKTRVYPLVCKGAAMKNGVGHNAHPFDCTKYVQCYDMGVNGTRAAYRRCNYGDFWDQENRRCRPSHAVQCPYDQCQDPTVQEYTHWDPDKCNAYWKCVDGLAYGDCCKEGEAYDKTLGCVPSTNCSRICPYSDRVPGCAKRPIDGSITKYRQYTNNGKWEEIKCPAKRAFSLAQCGCVIEDVSASKQCKPSLKLTFDNGFKDLSGKNTEVFPINVKLFDGAAYFGGRSSLQVAPFPATPDNSTDLVIKLRYQDDNRRGRKKKFQALVSNGHCRPGASSVFIGKNRKKVIMGGYSDKIVSLQLPVVPRKKWKDLIYIQNGKQFEGRACGAAESKFAFGKLKPTECGLLFGNAQGLRGFTGKIDDITVYQCMPLADVVQIEY